MSRIGKTVNLRQLNIGTRLGLGFGLVLLVSGALLVGSLLTAKVQREQLLHALKESDERASHVNDMQLFLLRSSISVRNTGMQTTVAAIQRDEADAKRYRASYLAARRQLQQRQLGDEEQAALQRLSEIDRQTEADFKEAVDLASTLNLEPAAELITQRIEPLLQKANAELAIMVDAEARREARTKAEALESSRRVERISLAAGLVTLAAAAFLARRVTLSITQPLRMAEQAATQVARGELDFVIDARGRDESTRLLLAVGAMRDSLSQVVAHVRVNSESVARASSEIAQGNMDLSDRTEQQASALQETAASMAQLGTAVRHNADSARQANQMAQGAADVARRGGAVVGEVVQTMKGINDSSRKIADIIGTIDGIAFQTNILALNAAVEAARAGEQGRGFAVVAGEVRALAQRSAGAAREIKGLILASVERVEQGSHLVDQAGKTMSDVGQAIQRVTEMMGAISSANSDQSADVSQLCEAVALMDRATQQNVALVEQSAAATESLKQQAGALVSTVAVFKLAGGLS